MMSPTPATPSSEPFDKTGPFDKARPFDRSAAYYDLLHAGRNYDRWAALYAHHLRLPAGNARDCSPLLIEWGCGTGEMLRHFLNRGYRAIGAEPNPAMRAIAARKVPADCLADASLTDVRFCTLPIATAACAPFAVISYAGLANIDLIAALRRVRLKLHRGGRFAFDVIHAAAAVSALRDREVKSASTPVGGIVCGVNGTDAIDCSVVESRRKSFDCRTSAITIESHFKITRWPAAKLNQCDEEFYETHRMRAFSPPEIELALTFTGFRSIAIFCPENDHETEFGETLWSEDFYLMVVAEAV